MLGNITSYGGNDRNGRRKEKIETKYRWESIDVIPLFPLVQVNNLSTYNTNFQKNGISLYNI